MAGIGEEERMKGMKKKRNGYKTSPAQGAAEYISIRYSNSGEKAPESFTEINHPFPSAPELRTRHITATRILAHTIFGDYARSLPDISLGRKMLHTSFCILLKKNRWNRREEELIRRS